MFVDKQDVSPTEMKTMLGVTCTLPRWLIDCTSDLANQRLFFVHTQRPELIGELVPHAEVPANEVPAALKTTLGLTLCRIIWKESPAGQELYELTLSLEEAIEDFLMAAKQKFPLARFAPR